MRIIYSALVAAAVIGSTMALGACAAYDDGYGSSVSVGVGYDDGYYYQHPHHHYWRRGYYN